MRSPASGEQASLLGGAALARGALASFRSFLLGALAASLCLGTLPARRDLAAAARKRGQGRAAWRARRARP